VARYISLPYDGLSSPLYKRLMATTKNQLHSFRMVFLRSECNAPTHTRLWFTLTPTTYTIVSHHLQKLVVKYLLVHPYMFCFTTHAHKYAHLYFESYECALRQDTGCQVRFVKGIRVSQEGHEIML